MVERGCKLLRACCEMYPDSNRLIRQSADPIRNAGQPLFFHLFHISVYVVTVFHGKLCSGFIFSVSQLPSVLSAATAACLSIDCWWLTCVVLFVQRSTRSCCQIVYYWTLSLPCRWRSHMERSTGRRHLSAVSAQTTKTASVSTFISWPSLINLFLLCVVLVVAACYLGHLKNFLIDPCADCGLSIYGLWSACIVLIRDRFAPNHYECVWINYSARGVSSRPSGW